MKRKILVLVAAIITVFALSSCGGEESLKLGEKATINGAVEFTPKNVIISNSVYPPMADEDSTGYTEQNSELTYITVVATAKNITDKSIPAYKLCSLKLDSVAPEGEDVSGITYEAGAVYALTENESVLSDSANIEPGAEMTVYACVGYVDKKVLPWGLNLYLGVYGSDNATYPYVMKIDGSKTLAVEKEMKLGEAIEVEGACRLTPKSVDFTDRLEPENGGREYEFYYPQGEDNTLMCVTIDAENLSKESLSAYKIYGVSAVCEGKTYAAQIVSNNADNSNMDLNNKVDANAVRKTHAIITVPKGLENGPVEIYLYTGGEYYHYTYTK